MIINIYIYGPVRQWSSDNMPNCIIFSNIFRSILQCEREELGLYGSLSIEKEGCGKHERNRVEPRPWKAGTVRGSPWAWAVFRRIGTLSGRAGWNGARFQWVQLEELILSAIVK